VAQFLLSAHLSLRDSHSPLHSRSDDLPLRSPLRFPLCSRALRTVTLSTIRCLDRAVHTWTSWWNYCSWTAARNSCVQPT